MRPTYELRRSNRKAKKFMVTHDGKSIYFGASGFSDYTKHKDHARMLRYDKRHKAHENWSDLNTPGAWAKWVLWNKPSLQDSIKDMERRFKINIVEK